MGPNIPEHQVLTPLEFDELPDYVIYAREAYHNSSTYFGVVSCVIFVWSWCEFFGGLGWSRFSTAPWLSIGYMTNFVFKILSVGTFIFWLL